MTPVVLHIEPETVGLSVEEGSTVSLSVEQPELNLSVESPVVELTVQQPLINMSMAEVVTETVYGGTGLEPVIVPVTQDGQTVFNIGGEQPRKTVHIAGLLLTKDVHYSLNLPYLTVFIPYLSTTDYITLT